ncbi:MAG TPA: PilZ domain-containing protein [Terriglobales bacterium]|nr:PilZ domain-containing protein [Terriglobales bacterium]
MHFQQSQRALDVMRSARPEQRRCSRVHFPIQAIAAFPEQGPEAETAFLRDISMLGAFFYCKVAPTIGENAELRFVLADDGAQPLEMLCHGCVIRIEDHPFQEAATGVAVQFTKYEVLSTARQKDEAPPISFVGSSLDMVEKSFARRTEFEKYACRVQGAA